MWERGLKCGGDTHANRYFVAPLVGAWIEIEPVKVFCCGNSVAPLVGAWIEIVCLRHSFILSVVVAPLVGAWIEIPLFKNVAL